MRRKTVELKRWYHVYSPDGYMALERASSESEAIMQAERDRPGYEGCWAELYIPEYEREDEDEYYKNALKHINEIKNGLDGIERFLPEL